MVDSLEEPGLTSDYPRRFRWPMRVFLSLFIFDMLVRSAISLTDYDDWAEELGVQTQPLALPSREEFDQIAAGNHPGYQSRGERMVASGRSVASFLAPWPDQQARAKIDSPLVGGQFAVAWLGTRLKFLGRMVGVDQSWPMFSPNVGKGDAMARFRLVYDDGSERVVRSLADPEDLTNYSHWFEEKHLQAQTKSIRDTDSRTGFCNFLAHRYSESETGSPLKQILVFEIRYDYPPPGADAEAFLRAQTGPPRQQIKKPFWSYDPRTRKGTWLKTDD